MARVLTAHPASPPPSPPQLQYRAPGTGAAAQQQAVQQPVNGSWNVRDNSLFKGSRAPAWALLLLHGARGPCRVNPNEAIPALIAGLKRRGVELGPRPARVYFQRPQARRTAFTSFLCVAPRRRSLPRL